MESSTAAAGALGLFFAQYGALGAFLLALLSLIGVFTWLWLRTSRELRQDNQGKITAQANEIERLEAARDAWRDKYYMAEARRLGITDEDSNGMEVT